MTDEGTTIGITIHMIVAGSDRASKWYQHVFGAKELNRIAVPDGRFVHVEVAVAQSTLRISDEAPEHGGVRPPPEIANSLAFYLRFEDVRTVWQRAIAAGATQHRPLRENVYGELDGQIVDPFGYRWGLTQHVRDVSLEESAALMFGN